MTAGEVLTAAHSLPFRAVRYALEDRPFVVVAPHPDDESLACGGLIADACRQEVRGKVVIVSDGSGSHPNSRAYAPDRLASLREEEARQAGAELGLKPADIVPSEGEDAERAIGVIADRVRAAGDMIHIAITRRPIKSRARSSFAWGKSDCSSMSSGDIRSHPRLRLIQSEAVSGSASITRRWRGSVSPLPRTARRQRLSSTTIPGPFSLARSTWPILICRMNSSLESDG